MASKFITKYSYQKVRLSTAYLIIKQAVEISSREDIIIVVWEEFPVATLASVNREAPVAYIAMKAVHNVDQNFRTIMRGFRK